MIRSCCIMRCKARLPPVDMTSPSIFITIPCGRVRLSLVQSCILPYMAQRFPGGAGSTNKRFTPSDCLVLMTSASKARLSLGIVLPTSMTVAYADDDTGENAERKMLSVPHDLPWTLSALLLALEFAATCIPPISASNANESWCDSF